MTDRDPLTYRDAAAQRAEAILDRSLQAERELAEARAEIDAVETALEEGGVTNAGASFDSPGDAVRETIAALRRAESERDALKAEVTQARERIAELERERTAMLTTLAELTLWKEG